MSTINYDGRYNIYTYMGWQLITAPDSMQYKLKEEAGMNFDSEGFGIINNCYVIACTTLYGNVGDYITWTLNNGDTLNTIVGDLKSSGDINWTIDGHEYDNGRALNVIEFIVDRDTWYNGHANPGTPSCHPEWAGLIQSYQNIGNYWEGTPIMPYGKGQQIVVTGKRVIRNTEYDVMYMAAIHKDGYVYFNDDIFWRCKLDGSSLQLLQPEYNKYWILSNGIKDIQVTTFNSASAFGNGSIAPNAKVEAAVQWMVNKATNEYITYSMSNRNMKNPDGSSYDCSSFVITGFYVGGYDANATTTLNMKQAFEDLGFTWIPGTYFSSNDCQRGDILLNISDGPGGGHTQVYIGNNQDVNCGGTPAKVQEHVPDFWGYGWNGILRAPIY